MKNHITFQIDNFNIWIEEENSKIKGVSFFAPIDLNLKETNILLEAKNQIEDYFKGLRKEFDLPIEYRGTKFQKQVWELLLNLNYGEVLTYKQVAEIINKPKAYRAVGMACNRNNIAIIIPCHRIVGVNGLVGYVGGLEIKEKLLGIEKASVLN